MAFLGWIGHYLLIFVVLAAVGGVGLVVGKRLGDRGDAKKSVESGDTTGEIK